METTAPTNTVPVAVSGAVATATPAPVSAVSAVAKPILPPPEQFLPTAYYPPVIAKSAPSVPTVTHSPTAGTLAQSLPLNKSSDLIKPDSLAPCLFSPHVPYQTGVVTPGTKPGYDYPNGNYMKWAQPPQPPQASQPIPAAQPITPDKSAEPNKPAEPLSPPQIDPRAAFSEAERNEVYNNMASSDETTRLQAAQTLARVLKKDPDMLTRPGMGEEVEALILNALSDPSSLVHQPLLVAFEAGNLNAPTPKIMEALQKLQRQNGLYNFEPVIVGNIINKLTAKTQANRDHPPSAAVENKPDTKAKPAAPVTMGANPALMQQYLAAANQGAQVPNLYQQQNTPQRLNVMSG